MYRERYSEIAADDQFTARQREYEALDRVVIMLEQAAAAGAGSDELEKALGRMEALWSIFLDDLCDPFNSLPEDLRARLISIGLWIVRRASEMRVEGDGDVSGLVAINASVRDGLR